MNFRLSIQNHYALYFLVLFTLSMACKQSNQPKLPEDKSKGKSGDMWVEIIDPKAKTLISEKSAIVTIARGFNWAEGTLWLKDQQALLFSDVPENKIYKWSEAGGLSTWLEPSGYTGPKEKKREGSNGLLLNTKNQLVICQHGDRRIAIMDAPLSDPLPKFISLVSLWRNKKLNSPNDAAFRNGSLYFTDPPYGLPGQDQDPEKELDFSGVYRVGHSGAIIMVTDSLSRPNGIGFSPGNEFMYIANSDPMRAIWMKYTIGSTGNAIAGKVLYDATSLVEKENGLPDGLKVHPSGNVFATGPGGLWIFSPQDEVIARIHIPQATANCAFDDTFNHLYIAADSTIIRVTLTDGTKQN
ncbi:MAG TPA: SMP-30/gluconolactonase/LRE family protein [Saprospiraceae bacterium]|nr:SMP-30/gluconolactonase/LRE family protein [Saprospiraceae bacterium]